MPRYPAASVPLPTAQFPTVSHPRDTHLPADGEDARLSVSLSWIEDRCVVTLVGSLNRSSAVAVASQFDQLIRAGFEEVVLELSGIREFEYSGAVALVELWSRLRIHGVRCRVHGLTSVSCGSPFRFHGLVRDLVHRALGLRTVTGAG